MKNKNISGFFSKIIIQNIWQNNRSLNPIENLWSEYESGARTLDEVKKLCKEECSFVCMFQTYERLQDKWCPFDKKGVIQSINSRGVNN